AGRHNRQGRGGRGVPGAEPADGRGGGDQADPHGGVQLVGGDRDGAQGDRRAAGPEPPQHRKVHRVRAVGPRARHHPGVLRGRVAAEHPEQVQQVPREPGGRVCGADPRRAGVSAPQRHPAPRHQARQHTAAEGGRGQAGGLWRGAHPERAQHGGGLAVLDRARGAAAQRVHGGVGHLEPGVHDRPAGQRKGALPGAAPDDGHVPHRAGRAPAVPGEYLGAAARLSVAVPGARAVCARHGRGAAVARVDPRVPARAAGRGPDQQQLRARHPHGRALEPGRAQL
ncbi:hypothetical protein IWQ56_007255, partial [Coemansia nantahalensis]